MMIEVSPYWLRPSEGSTINAQVLSSSIEGRLLRISFDDLEPGYASLQTWPELGDVKLSEALSHLQQWQGLTWPEALARFNDIDRCSQKTLLQAYSDAQARTLKKSLFERWPAVTDKMRNHQLLSAESSLTMPADRGAREKNFTSSKVLQSKNNPTNVYKVKMGKDLQRETRWLYEVTAQYSLRWRLDFNASLQQGQLIEWLEQNRQLLNYVDFIEDPTTFDLSFWQSVRQTYGVALALDFAIKPLAGEIISYNEVMAAIDVLIVKPARDHVDSCLALRDQYGCRLVFTHYMDHPIGRAHALAEFLKVADESLLTETHGLVGDCLQKQDLFSQHESQYGVGFDLSLSQVKWTLL